MVWCMRWTSDVMLHLVDRVDVTRDDYFTESSNWPEDLMYLPLCHFRL